uniref:Large ribosomal subunit protein mL45 n=1 Tax=Daphnia sinensis TaxID=1820382 RepID=A0A4Y7N9W2_9CRUS|nr:EOG090X0DDP [Daphnia sinensis]SVE89516.1 EOG090X0DDP [Daphnia sinensis]SVE90141.1 EOG090X0DDP [Daphnia sinensis]SVE90769.1 EOG090X0DDP [Daphnia sinensis]SVE91396.1 EOG090X0DDP [Daphnia sinensis]
MPALNAGIQVRERHTKHWDPKFKKLRKLKVQKVKLPDFREDDNISELTPDQIRSRMKEQGLLPPRSWMERPITISATGSVFEPYIPPEGDGKLSSLTLGGAKQSMEFLSKKSKSMLAVRKIRSFEDNFSPSTFAEEAQDIYIKAHKALAEKDYDTLHQCVTELCFPLMTDDLKMCTTRWQFLKSLEPPRVVHARCTDVINKENIFSQVTVRFHTQQTLAVYDRFGRLLYGSEVVAKDVLEYVVFEKHLANSYGLWRIHEKIIPDWMPVREPGRKTYVQQKPVVETEPVADSAVPATPTEQSAAVA